MEKNALAILAFLLLGGCSNSAKDVESATNKTPTASESVPDIPSVVSSADAAALLASTLKNAKMVDKRVMVHLGAPW